MRSLIRNTVLNSLGLLKTIGSGVHILNSHYISRNDLPPEVLYNLLMGLKKHADFIDFESAIQLINKKEKINQNLITFTFDDGFEECYTKIAPVLKQFNTNAAFFINPGFIDGDLVYKSDFTKNIVHVDKEPMSWDMIKELHKDGFVIGNHSLDHIRLVGLSDEEHLSQITKSKNIIEGKLNSKCDYFAWTYGTNKDIDSKALEFVLREHNFIFGGDNYKKYYSFNNDRVINRRHIEGDWPISHVKYFLSHNMTY